LRGLLWIVSTTANGPLGSVPVVGPPPWWMVGFYVAIGAVLITHRRELWGRIALRGLAAWSVLGLGVGLLPPGRPAGLTATFLSVGHGVAVLVETPNGRSLVYDAGQLQDAGRAEQIVESALWSSGRTGVDALVMSHADVDHFNAVPGLADEGLLRTVLLHPTFLDFRQEAVRIVCDRCAAQGVPIRFLWGGDRVRLDPEVEIEVLHPDSATRQGTDNANSLTLRIRYAGRSILLTGDLEGAGLGLFLARRREPVDVLLAPHHGAQASNTPELAAWAAPSIVVASTGYDGVEDRLRSRYGDQTLLRSTRDRGAVTVHITPEGELECSSFRGE
jgi:competence protein ComEC